MNSCHCTYTIHCEPKNDMIYTVPTAEVTNDPVPSAPPLEEEQLYLLPEAMRPTTHHTTPRFYSNKHPASKLLSGTYYVNNMLDENNSCMVVKIVKPVKVTDKKIIYLVKNNNGLEFKVTQSCLTQRI